MTTLAPRLLFPGLVPLLALLLALPTGALAQDTGAPPPPEGGEDAAEAEDAEDDEDDAEADEEADEAGDAAPLDEPSAPLDAPPTPEAPVVAPEAGAGLAAPTPTPAAPTAVADESVEEEALAAEAQAEAAPAAPPPKVWRNSFFFFGNEMSLYTLAPNGDLTYNPQFSSSFSLQPRWYLGPSLFLRLRQDAVIEWTDTEFRTRNRELVFNDTIVDILEGNAGTIAGITFSAGGRLILPTSIVSQNNSMVLGLGAIGLARYSMQVLSGLTWIVSGVYTYRHFDSNTGSFEDADDQPEASCAGSGGIIGCPISNGLTNTAHTLGLGASGVLGVTSSFFLSGSFSWSRGWDLQGSYGCVDTLTGPDCSGTNGENRNDITFFSLGGSYQFNKWLNIGLSVSTAKLWTLPSAENRNALFNRDSTISLTTQITLDQLYTDLFETQEGGRVALPGQPF